MKLRPMTALAREMGRIFGSMQRAYKAGFISAGNNTPTSASSMEWDGALPGIGGLMPFLSQLVNNGSAAQGWFNNASVTAASGATFSAGQMLGGLIVRSTQAATSDNTDSAANIVAAWPGCKVGDSALLFIVNLDSATLTLVAGSGITLAGTTTVLTVAMRIYIIKPTNVTAGAQAVTVTGVASSGAGWIA